MARLVNFAFLDPMSHSYKRSPMGGTQYPQLGPGLSGDQVRELLSPGKLPLVLPVCSLPSAFSSGPCSRGMCFMCFLLTH